MELFSSSVLSLKGTEYSSERWSQSQRATKILWDQEQSVSLQISGWYDWWMSVEITTATMSPGKFTRLGIQWCKLRPTLQSGIGSRIHFSTDTYDSINCYSHHRAIQNVPSNHASVLVTSVQKVNFESRLLICLNQTQRLTPSWNS